MSISAILLIRKKVMLLTLSLMMLLLAVAPIAGAAGFIEAHWKYKVTPVNPIYYSATFGQGYFFNVKTNFQLKDNQKAIFSIEKYSEERKKWEPYTVTILHAGQEIQQFPHQNGVDLQEHPGTYRFTFSFDGIDTKSGGLDLLY